MPRLGCLLALLIGLGACERTPAPPAPPAPAGAARVAALSPALAVMLRDLGKGHLIVARHGFDAWSDPALPVAGDQQGFDYEALLRVKPTHVLLQWGGKALPDRLTALAATHGWSVRDVPLLTLDDVEHGAEALFQLDSPAGTAWRDSPLARRMRAAWRAREPSPARAGPVLLLYSAAPPTALGPGSFHHQLLERIGGVPALREGSPFMRLDAEDAARLRPATIVLVRPGDAGTGRAAGPRWRILSEAERREQLGALNGLAIPAVVSARVGVLTHPLAAVPGTNLIDLADDLAEVLAALAPAP